MVATAARYARTHPGVEIVWEKRPLQAFFDEPLEELAARYDLIVIDHPHVGHAANTGCLVPINAAAPQRRRDLDVLAQQTIGQTHASFEYLGQQWALAIDAAAQVAVHRPDLLGEPPHHWRDVMILAQQTRVLWPLKPIDALLSFMSLCANMGAPCRTDGKAGAPLVSRADAVTVLKMMQALANLVPPECFDMGPSDIYDWLAMAENTHYVYSPLGFGYANYARTGFRPRRLRFADIAECRQDVGPRGSALGGAGIAVSARTRCRELALDYAFWLASASCQKGPYYEAGGQPSSTLAWEDPALNGATLEFFRATRTTLDKATLRPRYNGYLTFQNEGGSIIHSFLRNRTDPNPAASALEAAYLRSLR